MKKEKKTTSIFFNGVIKKSQELGYAIEKNVGIGGKKLASGYDTAISATVKTVNKGLKDIMSTSKLLKDSADSAMRKVDNSLKEGKELVERHINETYNSVNDVIAIGQNVVHEKVNDFIDYSEGVISNTHKEIKQDATSLYDSTCGYITTYKNQIEENLSLAKTTIGDFVDTSGKTLDEFTRDVVKATDNVYKRVDEKGYLQLSYPEIRYVLVSLIKSKIPAFSSFWSIYKVLKNIQTRSYKNDKKLKLYARFASYVYGTKKSTILPVGWERVYKVKDISFEDAKTGLMTMLFREVGTDRYIYAFAGTRNGKDWKQNGQQLFGMSEQYKQALNNAKKLHRLFPNISFTGHSQGGGEAALCAYNLGLEAVTFNPAGLSLLTKMIHSSKYRTKCKINYFIYLTDVLNMAQQLTELIPFIGIGPDGNPNYIYDKFPQKISISEFHGMEGFLNYLNITYENK